MFCGFCGYQMSEALNYCPSCGRCVSYPSTKHETSKKSTNHKKSVIVLLFVFFAIGISSVIVLTLRHKTHEPDSFFARQKGASSIEELFDTLNSSFLFTEKQVNCMSPLMIAWLFDEFDLCDQYEITKDTLEKMTSQDMADLFNDAWNKEDTGSRLFQIFEIGALDPEMANEIWDPDYFDLIAEEISNLFEAYPGIGDFFNQGILKNKNFQNVWTVTTGSFAYYRGENELIEHDYSNEKDCPFLVFEIGGRYYWSAIEMY